MVQRLMKGKHECMVYELNNVAIMTLVQQSVSGSGPIKALAPMLNRLLAGHTQIPAGRVHQAQAILVADKAAGAQL